jgi:uncharacterized membrane protein YccC
MSDDLPRARAERLLGSRRLHRSLRSIAQVTPGPPPLARMLRSGLSVAASFGLFAALGDLRAGVLAAGTANLLIFIDQGGSLGVRFGVLAIGAACLIGAGAAGAALAGSHVLLLATALAIATTAGLIHSPYAGANIIPRQAAIALLVGAYIPQIDPSALLPAAAGSGMVLAGLLVEHLVGHGAPAAPRPPNPPSLRFAIVYGFVAILGLLFADLLGAARPFWVTITTLIVMQPGRAASVKRALERFAGTIAGVVAAFLLAALAARWGGHALFIAALLVLPFWWPLGLARNPAVGVALISAWVLLLLDLSLPSPAGSAALFLARLGDTAIGCLLAVVGTAVASGPDEEATAAGP